ncbi:glycoside hydrolase family 2 protein [Planctomycetota bacterium]
MCHAKRLRITFSLLMVLLVCTSMVSAKVKIPARQTQVLKTGWVIKQLNGGPHDIASLTEAAQKPDKTWLRTDMPKQVADVLLHYGRIPDPHVGKNAAACAWIWEQDWAYSKTFATPSGEGPVWLRLMGVDTIATVYVNGQEVGRCNNMFRRYAFDIRSTLKDNGENVLLVVFAGPAKELTRIEREVKLEYGIAATKYMRKSHCDFNNYLGARPNFMKVGLFREVFLDVPGTTWLEDTAIRPTLSGDLTKADVQVQLDAHGPSAQIRYTLADAKGKPICQGTATTADRQFSFTVNQPRLWWPHTHGEPYLYTLTLEVLQGATLQDVQQCKVGFRKIEHVTLDENTGEARFAFKINNRPIYLKGAGWAPLEGMSHVWDRQRSDRQIALGKQANMNLFRMWAEGSIPPAHWYEACDEQGILVWQDFYFGYGISPFHEPDFRTNAEAEIVDTIKRLRNHPSIFLWVGGNENQMGWEFARGYGPIPNRHFNESTMPALVRQHDPTRMFHPSSPFGGPYSNYPLRGDWHDYTTLNFVPLSSVPLFNSELCRVSPPPAASMRRYMTEEEFWPEGFAFKVDRPGKIAWPDMWEYRSAGSAWDKIGSIEKFCDPQNAEDLVRVLGTAHGENWQQRVEQQRRGALLGMPDGNRRCWGSMVWRLNDSWPITYMSAIDYYLEPKICYYYLKRAFSPVLLSFEQTADKIFVWVINDSAEAVAGNLTLTKMDFQGKQSETLSRYVHINPGEAERCLDATPLRTIVKNREFLTAEFNGQIVTHLVNAERYLHLPQATLDVKVLDDEIVVSTDVYAKQVTFEMPGVTGAVFSDNYFDLFPGQARRIRVLRNPGSNLLTVRSLNSKSVFVNLDE